MSLVYDLFLFFGYLFHRIRKKQGASLREKLGFDLPDPKGREVYWFHAVSVGEMKAAASFFSRLRAHLPDAFLLVTATTQTGLEEAKRSLLKADAYRFLPLDLSFICKRWAKQLKPKALFLIESDIWPHLLLHLKRAGSQLFLLSGKLSATSARRFLQVRWFSRKLFHLFDAILVQNQEYLERFQPLVLDQERLLIGGNLKWDARAVAVPSHFASYFPPRSIALTCTHAPEEEELLAALRPLGATLFLAPRHPERCPLVEAMLQKQNFRYCLWSQIDKRKGDEEVILIDRMGELPILYRYCQLAIIGGSFSSKVGGHNVFEPILYGIPSLFGPHMETQREFAERLIQGGVGLQITLQELAVQVESLLQNLAPMKVLVQQFISETQGSLNKTWDLCLKKMTPTRNL